MNNNIINILPLNLFFIYKQNFTSLIEILLLCKKHSVILIKIPKVILIEIISFVEHQFIRDSSLLNYLSLNLSNDIDFLTEKNFASNLRFYSSPLPEKINQLQENLNKKKRSLITTLDNVNELNLLMEKYKWLNTYKYKCEYKIILFTLENHLQYEKILHEIKQKTLKKNYKRNNTNKENNNDDYNGNRNNLNNVHHDDDDDYNGNKLLN